jgi:general secretion pathway protein J
MLPGRSVRITRNHGFTLFEMVIAVSIFALMGVVAFTGLSQMTHTGEAVADANKRLSDLQFAVVYFSRDWAQVSPRKIRDQYGDEASNIEIEDGSISFTRGGWSNQFDPTRSTLQRVQYLVVDNQLVRRHWASLDQAPGTQPFQSVLLDNVEQMEVEFFNSSEEPVRTWPEETASGEASNPLVLVFRLDLKDMGQITRILEVPGGVL